MVLCESTFRRTLQNLDADALNDADGAWTQSAPLRRPARIHNLNISLDGYAAGEHVTFDLALRGHP